MVDVRCAQELEFADGDFDGLQFDVLVLACLLVCRNTRDLLRGERRGSLHERPTETLEHVGYLHVRRTSVIGHRMSDIGRRSRERLVERRTIVRARGYTEANVGDV